MVVLGTVLLIVVNLPFDLLLSLLLYVVGTATMFGVSALYHRVPWRPKAKALMQRFDHSAIFLAIAGGYTPVAVLCLDGWTRWAVLVGEDRSLPTLGLQFPQEQLNARQQRHAVQHRLTPIGPVDRQGLLHPINRHEVAHRLWQSSTDRTAHLFIRGRRQP